MGNRVPLAPGKIPGICQQSLALGVCARISFSQRELYIQPLCLMEIKLTSSRCWDGKNLDSSDHKSHVAYPSGSFEAGGACPSSHPVKIPQLFYETVWDTRQFNDPAIWPTDGSQPFVFSQMDRYFNDLTRPTWGAILTLYLLALDMVSMQTMSLDGREMLYKKQWMPFVMSIALH